MRRLDESFPLFLGLACLLAFAPVVRGGHTVWSAFLMTAGMGCLISANLIRGLWKGTLSFAWSPADFIFLIGMLWFFLSLKRAFAVPEAFDSLLILLGCLGCFFLTRNLSSRGLGLNLFLALNTIAAAIVLTGILQIMEIIPHGWWNPARFMASTFINHNHFAAYLELLFPAGCFLMFSAPLKPPARFLLILTTAFLGMGLVLSCSRGAWLSLVLSAAGVLGWYGIRNVLGVWNWKKTVVLTAVLLAVGYVATQPPIYSRGLSLLDTESDSSIQMRRAIWQGSWDLARENPVLGQGAGSYLYTFTRHRPAGLYRLINYAHNDYLQLVAEFGLIGLGIALAAAWPILLRVTRLIRDCQTAWKRSLGFGAFIGMGSLALHSLADFPWHIPAVVYQCAALAGLVTGLGYETDRFPLKSFRFSVPAERQSMRKIAALLIAVVFLAAAWPVGSLLAADIFAVRGNLESAIRLAPYRVHYHEAQGEHLARQAFESAGWKRGAYLKQSAEAYRNALKLAPRNARSAHALGNVLKSLGNLQEAEESLLKSVTEDPRNPLYWKDLGEIKVMRGDASAAAEAFRRAAQLAAPHNFFPKIFGNLDKADYFFQQGETELSLGHASLAHTNFAAALILDPAHPRARAGLAVSAMKAGDSENARREMAKVEDPVLKAQWHASLAQDSLSRGEVEKAKASLETSLKLDPSNLLSHHLRVMMHEKQAEENLLLLNQSPVFIQTGESGQTLLVWEPEEGVYEKGQKIYQGWALFGKGAIQQSLALPPGKVHFRVMARGTKAKGVGPMLELSWAGKIILSVEVTDEEWAPYEIETEIKSGESRLGVAFVNDYKDPVTKEDRNLKIDKVIARWGPR